MLEEKVDLSKKMVAQDGIWKILSFSGGLWRLDQYQCVDCREGFLKVPTLIPH